MIKIPFKRLLLKKNDEPYQIIGLFKAFKDSNEYLKTGELTDVLYNSTDVNKTTGLVINKKATFARLLLKKIK